MRLPRLRELLGSGAWIIYLFFLCLCMHSSCGEELQGTAAQQRLAEQRLDLRPWLQNVKVYIYDMAAAGFQSEPDIFRPDGRFCDERCSAQYKAPIWGADLCNHGYGHALDELQVASSLGMYLLQVPQMPRMFGQALAAVFGLAQTVGFACVANSSAISDHTCQPPHPAIDAAAHAQ